MKVKMETRWRRLCGRQADRVVERMFDSLQPEGVFAECLRPHPPGGSLHMIHLSDNVVLDIGSSTRGVGEFDTRQQHSRVVLRCARSRCTVDASVWHSGNGILTE